MTNYSPNYISGDPNNPVKELEKYFSKNEIKRKIAEKAIKIGRPHFDECWVKLGKLLIIIQPDANKSNIATQAQIWWEYHFQLMPKIIKWETVKEVVK